MVKEVIANNEERMKKTLSAAKVEFASLRAGRATPALLDKVMVEYYGSLVPVNQVGNISVPEPRMILIQPWEKPMLHEIEKNHKDYFELSYCFNSIILSGFCCSHAS